MITELKIRSMSQFSYSCFEIVNFQIKGPKVMKVFPAQQSIKFIQLIGMKTILFFVLHNRTEHESFPTGDNKMPNIIGI